MTTIYILQHTIGTDIDLMQLYAYDNILDAVVHSIVLTNRVNGPEIISKCVKDFKEGKLTELNMNEYGLPKNKYWFQEWYSDLGHTNITVTKLNEKSFLKEWHNQ